MSKNLAQSGPIYEINQTHGNIPMEIGNKSQNDPDKANVDVESATSYLELPTILNGQEGDKMVHNSHGRLLLNSEEMAKYAASQNIDIK